MKADVIEKSRQLLGTLLREGIVDYLLVPQSISQGRAYTQTLVSSLEHLREANPFSPVMPVNSASLCSQLSKDTGGKKVAVVLKPCEIRAMVELVKLGQVSLENLLVIGIECAGTLEPEDFARVVDGMRGRREEKETRIIADLYNNSQDVQTGNSGLVIRSSCSICTTFLPSNSDLTLRAFGDGQEVLADIKEDLADQLGQKSIKETSSVQGLLEDLRKARNDKREKVFAEFRGKMKCIDDLADIFATCSRCYACSSACPICYCKVCFFRTDTFEPESGRYFRWADKEGAIRMPSEIMLYQLTRLNHIAASCIGCGLCESSCPRGIPLSTIFQAVGDGVQKELKYSPGERVEDEIPIATFRQPEK